jgi:hypothetical protein
MDEEFADILGVTSVYRNGKVLYAVSQLVDVIQPFLHHLERKHI